MSLQKLFEDAEKNARIRDLKNNKEMEINLSIVAEQEKKANALGFGLYKIKKTNKIPFIQLLDQNTDMLLKHGYITLSDLGFLSGIARYIEIGTNAIKNPDTKQYMNLSELACILNLQRETVSRRVNKLIEKGIIFELVSKKELKMNKRIVSNRPLFVNPEIFYKGDKNQISPMLCDMVMESDVIERNKIPLPYKVWHDSSEKFGKFYTRRTYLNKIKNRIKKVN